MPPVMGAGAYMMLEIINRDPPVRFLEIVQAAIIPSILYYFSIFMLVHFYACRLDATAPRAAAERLSEPADRPALVSFAGFTFVAALVCLMGLLFAGFSPFRAVSLALALVVSLILAHPATGPSAAARIAALAAWAGLAAAAGPRITCSSVAHLA